MHLAPATVSTLPAPEAAREPRMTLVDGLRGVAACAVLLFHFCMAARLPFEGADWMPDAVEWVLEHGWLGVQLFFVLSGFVIAYSVRGRAVTPSFTGRFALRRAIRLDPPYWLILLLEVALLSLTGRAWDGEHAAVDVGDVAAHFFYLQEFFGYPEMVGVFWTLCAEVQLYLAFILLLGLAQCCSRTSGERPQGRRMLAFVFAFVPLTVGSVLWLAHGGSAMPWALAYWYMFLLGALVWWTLDGFLPGGWLLALVAAIVGVVAFVRWEPMAVVALATAGVLWVAGRRGTLTTWLSARPIQYVGRISYSLYLVHLVVGDRILRGVLEAYGRTATTFAVGSALGLAGSFCVAHLLHVWIERPALRLARRIRLGPRPDVEPTPAPVPATFAAPRVRLAEAASSVPS
jgi:peptidoglycan/LPS O-acetylase OafA/YrhL